MSEISTGIRPLPPDVIAQIKSSAAITSLNDVVVELMKNSLDAASTKTIDISVDYARGGCVVEDDGLGILPSEFGENGGLGKLYHTSKLANETPLHGGRGTFLASLSAMALLSITSHHHLHRSHNAMSMHKSQVISRQIPAPTAQHLPYFAHGTRVTVRDLFGSMPVRVKQRAVISKKHGGNSKDWELLKRDVSMLLLAWPSAVCVTLRDAGTSQKLVIRSPESKWPMDISKTCSILSHASLITRDEISSWILVSASTAQLDIKGTISLIPSATKHVQFITFGIQPLMPFDGQSILHDEINRLFQNSAFGNEEFEEPDEAEKSRRTKDARYTGDGFTNKAPKGAKKGVDRWPMFYLNIQPKQPRYMVELDDILEDKGNTLSAITELIQATILEFLTGNHFHPTRKEAFRIINKNIIEDTFSNDRHTRTRSRNPPVGDTNTKASKGPRRPISNSDFLGENVKLPSFRHASATESPFDAWSRVKSGAPRSRPDMSKNKSLAILSPLHRPATAPLPSKYDLSSATARSSTPASRKSFKTLPLISSTGKITRRPFDEVHGRPSGTLSSVPRLPVLTIDKDNGDDETITWIDPITKVESLVNQRTGLTLRPNKGGGAGKYTATRALRLPSHNIGTKHAKQEPSEWIGSLLKNWDNPIFRPTEAAVPQVSLDGLDRESQRLLRGHKHNCSQLDIDKAFKEVSAGIHGRISKHSLRDAEVISQVDKKFILVKLGGPNSAGAGAEEMLVIIDQHAADERIRIESLLSDLCPPPKTPTESRIPTNPLSKPLIFDIPGKEVELFRSHTSHFTNWGIIFSIPSPTNEKGARLIVHSLPPIIAERCTSNPRLLVDLIRTELHHVASTSISTSIPTPQNSSTILPTPTWLTQVHTIPRGLLDMLNSRACRSAIMFNDELSKAQCEVLVKRLAGCMFPFQCAHGRPSLVPLVELGGVWRMYHSDGKDQGHGFAATFRKWKKERS